MTTSGPDAQYPLAGFYFKVTLNDTDTSFQEVSGISVEVETETLYEGGENRRSYQVPKRIKYPNLVLKRGIAPVSSPLVDWCKKILESEFTEKIKRDSLNVQLMDAEGNPIRVWNFTDAYPVKWSVDAFNSQKNEVAIETIELVYASSTREK